MPQLKRLSVSNFVCRIERRGVFSFLERRLSFIVRSINMSINSCVYVALRCLSQSPAVPPLSRRAAGGCDYSKALWGECLAFLSLSPLSGQLLLLSHIHGACFASETQCWEDGDRFFCFLQNCTKFPMAVNLNTMRPKTVGSLFSGHVTQK